MKIHEYQAKQLLAEYGAPIPLGIVATTPEDVKIAATHYEKTVIKAQVHAGGRGKAGGVRLAKNSEEAFEVAQAILGMKIINQQTGPQGKVVTKVLVTEAISYQKEFYLAIAGDYDHAGLMVIASSDGGTEIEDVASSHPERIIKIPIPAQAPISHSAIDIVAHGFALNESQHQQLITLLDAMLRLYLAKDCTLVEINPLVITTNDELLCLDAKVTFDDNALFRHLDVLGLRDVNEEDPKEYKASQHDLSYVTLDGDIGCLVNGAGLAMATLDIIKNYGGNPANFLDVGGSATVERVKVAFEILLSDPHVKAIFINIFGGIMKCDVIATGVIMAAKEIGVKVPIIVRLEGTNVDLGREILKQSGLDITSAVSMADGAIKAIEAARGSIR